MQGRAYDNDINAQQVTIWLYFLLFIHGACQWCAQLLNIPIEEQNSYTFSLYSFYVLAKKKIWKCQPTFDVDNVGAQNIFKL